MSELNEAQIVKLLKERGENPSLPFLVFSQKGSLVLANERGLKVLELSKNHLPVSKDDLLKTWAFYNEEMGIWT